MANHVTAGGGVDFQEFEVSGNWVKPPGAVSVYVEMVNGGSGGNCNIKSANSDVSGGDGGAFVSVRISADDLLDVVPVVVGAGGLGKEEISTSGTASTIVVAQTTGGASSFGGITCPLKIPAGAGELFQGVVGSGPKAFGTFSGGGAGGSFDANSGGETVGLSERHGDGGALKKVAGYNNVDATAGDGEFPAGGGGAVLFDTTIAGVTGKAGDGANGLVRVWTVVV